MTGSSPVRSGDPTTEVASPGQRTGWDELPQAERVRARLQPEDSPTTTWGCRCANPEACGKNGMPKVCAFVRPDGICLAPPRGWPRRYARLLEDEQGTTEISPGAGLETPN